MVSAKAEVRGAKLFDHVIIKGNAYIHSNLTVLGDSVLGRNVRITGYIGRDTIIKLRV